MRTDTPSEARTPAKRLTIDRLIGDVERLDRLDVALLLRAAALGFQKLLLGESSLLTGEALTLTGEKLTTEVGGDLLACLLRGLSPDGGRWLCHGEDIYYPVLAETNTGYRGIGRTCRHRRALRRPRVPGQRPFPVSSSRSDSSPSSCWQGSRVPVPGYELAELMPSDQGKLEVSPDISIRVLVSASTPVDSYSFPTTYHEGLITHGYRQRPPQRMAVRNQGRRLRR